MAQSMTPTKTCVLGDACIICGFLFVQFEKTTDGTDIIHKFYQNKLNLIQKRWIVFEKLPKNRTLISKGVMLGSVENALDLWNQ